MNLIKYEKIKSEYDFTPVKFKTYVKEKGYVENVSTITGVAIPLYYE